MWPAISGSNDTTGKDCVRYGFRQNFYGETAANAIGPVLVKAYGKNRKAAFMTPDYTYGHTVTKSVNDYLTSQGGWTQVTDQVSPLGTQDFSQYLTNIANSGAEFIINVNWGRDAVLSVQQAKQFGLTPKMKMVIPYQIPFLAKEVGPELTEGVFAATDFWWTLEDKYPLAKMFVDAFQKKYGYRPEWGAENGYISFAHWARMVSEAGSFYPPDVIKQYEKGETIPSMVGDVHYRPEDHQCVRPVVIVRGKAPKDMKNPEDYLGSARCGAGRAADAEAGRLRLRAWRLHLTAPIAFSAPRGHGEGPSTQRPSSDGRKASLSPGSAVDSAHADGLPVVMVAGAAAAVWAVHQIRCGRRRGQLG